MAGTKKREMVPAPPDGGYGWVVLAASFFVSFIIDGCMYSFGIILSEIRDYYGVSQEKANLLSSLNTGFLFCSGPIVAGLTNKLGIRPVVMGAAVITGLCYVGSAYAPSIYLAMVGYGVIGGISTGCTYISSIIIVAQYFEKRQGVATGITMAGSGVGAFVFAQVAQLMIANFDWQFTMIILGSIILECCVLGALLKPVPMQPKEKNTKAHDFTNVQAYTGSLLSIANSTYEEDESCCSSCLKLILDIFKEMTNLSLLKKNVGFLFIVFSNFFLFSGFFLPYIYIPIRLKELKIEGVSIILGLMGLLNIPARLTLGFLADLNFVSPLNINSICVLLATVSLWIYPFLNTLPLQIVFSVIFAIGTAGMNCLTTPYTKQIVGMQNFSNATGIISLFRGFGCFLGPFLGGFISDKFKSTLAAFFFASIAFSVGTAFSILSSFIVKFKKPETQYSATQQS